MKVSAIRLVSVVWLLIAGFLAFAPTKPGDESLLVGLAFQMWTFPFSILWWRYVHDFAMLSMPSIGESGGLVAVIVTAYVFWFIFVPWLFAIGRRSTGHKSRVEPSK